MNVLVTGSKGQLGQELQQIAGGSGFQFFFTDVEELNITDKVALNNYFDNCLIDCIINCAAYTAVDKAESKPEKAESINSLAVKNLKEISEIYNCYFIHISTDYVFDGKSYKPYIESDDTNPQSVYGTTKLHGEKHLEFYNKALIIRTSWLYSVYGNNTVKTVLKYGKEREEIKFIFDQVGSPTNAADLAAAIVKIMELTSQNPANFIPGIYHYSNEGVCSWYDFAKEIIDLAKINCKVTPIETKDYPTPVTRPFYSVLNKHKIKSVFGIEIPHWKDSLKECLVSLNV